MRRDTHANGFRFLLLNKIEEAMFLRYTVIKALGCKTRSKKERNMARMKTAAKKTTKKAEVKTVAKKTAAKKTATKTKGMAKGSQYTCGVCGLGVKVANPCDCPETSHLVCCEKPMKKKK
jgi:hypothetical protein